jgi:hypothetical protein
MDAIDLAVFDDPPAYSLDPSVWRANLDALRALQPDFARAVAGTAPPSHWRPVTGLDDFATYRVEQAGAPPEWLAGTAAPATRAAALLASQPPSHSNQALPTIAAGAELSLLLQRLPRQQAVFVFEPDLAHLAAVLRTVDVAEAVAAGRCVLVPPSRERDFLEQLLERYPGLLPPTTIAAPLLDDLERLGQLRKTCETVARHTNESRARRLATLAQRWGAQPSTPGAHPRLAILALGPDASSHQLATRLAAAADQLGWAACSRAASSPRNVHPLAHCEALADFDAQLFVCVGHPPGALPLPPGKPVCQWHLHTRDVPPSLPHDATLHLAATPRVVDTLRTAGVPAERVIDFHWATPAGPADRASRNAAAWATRAPDTAVVLVGDLPDASAAACGIGQPTHRKLWSQLHETARQAWETHEITQPATLLRNAERTCRINLGERSLSERMVRIIAHVLIPAVVLETILRALRREACEVLAVGRGWQRCSEKPPAILAESLDQLPSRAADLPVMAAVFGGLLDPLTPALLHAAALGWPLLIHNPCPTPLTAQLGGILHPRQHYEPFAGQRDLRDRLEALRRDPGSLARRCERVHAHLNAQHTYGHRLTALARQLALDWPGIEP